MLKMRTMTTTGTPAELRGAVQEPWFPAAGLTGVTYRPKIRQITAGYFHQHIPMVDSVDHMQIVTGPNRCGWSYSLMAPIPVLAGATEVDTLDRAPGHVLLAMEALELQEFGSEAIHQMMVGAYTRQGLVRGTSVHDIIMPSTSLRERLVLFKGRRRYVLTLPEEVQETQLAMGFFKTYPGLVVMGSKGSTQLYGSAPCTIAGNEDRPDPSYWKPVLELPAPLWRIGRVNGHGLMPIHLTDNRVVMVRMKNVKELEVVRTGQFGEQFVALVSGDDADAMSFNEYFGLTTAVLNTDGTPTCAFVRPILTDDDIQPEGNVVYTFVRADMVPRAITGL